MNLYLGRCPRLLHFAPLALRPWSFHTVSTARGSVPGRLVSFQENRIKMASWGTLGLGRIHATLIFMNASPRFTIPG